VARRDQKRHIVIVNFEKYHDPKRAAVSSAARKNFDSEPLSWVRLQCDWYRDIDILDLPRAVRSLWPQLIAMAGSSIPHGTVFTSVQNLAKAGNLGESEVAEALTFLWKRHKIRYSVAGKRQSDASQAPAYVPTYLRTNKTDEAVGKETTKNDGSWIQDPELRRRYQERQSRKQGA